MRTLGPVRNGRGHIGSRWDTEADSFQWGGGMHSNLRLWYQRLIETTCPNVTIVNISKEWTFALNSRNLLRCTSLNKTEEQRPRLDCERKCVSPLSAAQNGWKKGNGRGWEPLVEEDHDVTTLMPSEFLRRAIRSLRAIQKETTCSDSMWK